MPVLGAQAGITWLGLAASLVLVVVSLVISAAQHLGLGRSITWASVRALGQLLAVGLALRIVVDPKQPLAYAWLWVLAMVVMAAATVQRRAPEVPGSFWVALPAFGAAAVVTLLVLFGFGVFPLEGRTLVPLAGMVLGNSLTATVLVARRVVEELAEKRDEVEARLALGHTARVAARPYLRGAVRTALVPQVESTKAVGLIFLPGAMTGMILAGAEPFTAVLVQAAIMYLVLGAVTTTTAVVALELQRRLFTADHRLVHLPRRPH